MLFLLTTLALAQDITTEAVETDTALVPGRHLADVVLEALERAEFSFPDLLRATLDADVIATTDLPVEHVAARDGADARDVEDGANLDLPTVDLLELGLEKP